MNCFQFAMKQQDKYFYYNSQMYTASVPVAARSKAVRLLRFWVRFLSGAWMFVSCVCCVLSGRCLYDELTTRPEESYRQWCVFVCDVETLRMGRTWPSVGCCVKNKKNKYSRLSIMDIKVKLQVSGMRGWWTIAVNRVTKKNVIYIIFCFVLNKITNSQLSALPLQVKMMLFIQMFLNRL
jgi:hypothetical protein